MYLKKENFVEKKTVANVNRARYGTSTIGTEITNNFLFIFSPPFVYYIIKLAIFQRFVVNINGRFGDFTPEKFAKILF